MLLGWNGPGACLTYWTGASHALHLSSIVRRWEVMFGENLSWGRHLGKVGTVSGTPADLFQVFGEMKTDSRGRGIPPFHDRTVKGWGTHIGGNSRVRHPPRIRPAVELAPSVPSKLRSVVKVCAATCNPATHSQRAANVTEIPNHFIVGTSYSFLLG